MVNRHRNPPLLHRLVVRSSVLVRPWTTTSTITLTITHYRFELREHRHLCLAHRKLSSRHDIVMRPDRPYPGGVVFPRNWRLETTAGSEYLGFSSGRVWVTAAMEEPPEAGTGWPACGDAGRVHSSLRCWPTPVHARCASFTDGLCDLPRTPREVAQTAGDAGSTTRRRAEQGELPRLLAQVRHTSRHGSNGCTSRNAAVRWWAARHGRRSRVAVHRYAVDEGRTCQSTSGGCCARHEP